MKRLLLATLLFTSLASSAQETAAKKERTPAAPGVVYGVVKADGTAFPVEELRSNLSKDQFSGQVRATVVEVCQAEGCWIKVKREGEAPMMVRAANHAFLMPENLVGHTVVIEGTAQVKEVSEAMRRHYAEDAGKSKKEIEAIKGPEKDIQFSATGVRVLD